MQKKSSQSPPLTVVATGPDPAPTAADPPGNLGQPGRTLWAAIQAEFRITDPGGVSLLHQIALATDRAEALRQRIDADGEAIASRTGLLKAHPLLRDELANRAFISRSLQRLGVLDMPIKPIGRPSQPLGWRGWGQHDHK
jgi:hypothetical protein